jgi:4a-hydroxytetrahydrobiopterin dehydratase
METLSAEAKQLAGKSCVPCRGGTPPLKGPDLARLSAALPSWTVVREHHLERKYELPDFKSALAFVNGVGALAEEQNHHPDITLAWGKVGVSIWTHVIDGLTESDFVFAAKVEALLRGSK